MSTTLPNSEYEECIPAAQIRVLWAAKTPPNLNLLNAVHVGLSCFHLGEKNANSTNAAEPLHDHVLAAITNAHLLFVVSDCESKARTEQVGQACKNANRSSIFHVHLQDDDCRAPTSPAASC